MIPLNLREPNLLREQKRLAGAVGVNTRVAIPGIVDSFDPAAQTVTVRPAIRELMMDDGDETWIDIPLLVDVPIVLPRAGNYLLTMPITKGDECLVVFGDMCIDAWWQSGNIQNQIDRRRHDLSDGFAILGCWSQPNVVPNYSTNSAQLRNESGSSYVEISGNNINIVASGNVNIKGAEVHINE